MPNFVIHNNNKVINIIVADTLEIATAISDGNQIFEMTEPIGVDWVLIDNTWYPPKPFDSWILQDGIWSPPIPAPNPLRYDWIEENQEWVEKL